MHFWFDRAAHLPMVGAESGVWGALEEHHEYTSIVNICGPISGCLSEADDFRCRILLKNYKTL
jgi:hypothetical protein